MKLSRSMKLERRRENRTCADGALSLKLMLLMTACFGARALTVQATTTPAWWSARGAVTIASPSTNDYDAVSMGQLKFFTQKAVDELNADLTNNGGAGTNLNTMVANWSNEYVTNHYTYSNPKPSDRQAVNIGQLKYIGNLIYSQL